MLLKGKGPPLGSAAGGAGTHRCQLLFSQDARQITPRRRKTQNLTSLSPEFIAVITVGVAQLAGLLILDLFLGKIMRETSASTRIQVLNGGPVEEVPTDLRQAAS
jgi:hypothetical protein